MKRVLSVCFLCLCMCTAAFANPPAGFTSLFDGQSLAGWTALPGGEWSVKAGVIVGMQDKSEARHGQLVSDKTYGNFVLKLKYMARKGNSGVYFRVKKVDHAVAVNGFQAEVDAAGRDVAGLYETRGRGWVSRPNADKVKAVYKPQDWNEMTVVAMGGNVTVVLNGVVMTELKDDPGLREGYIALQLHGGQAMDVRYKDITIREYPSEHYPIVLHSIHDKTRALPSVVQPKAEVELADAAHAPAEAIVLFDGRATDAWHTQWPIIDGVLQTGKGGCTTTQTFANCHVHLEWRVTNPDSAGNSGVFLMDAFEVQVFNSYNNRTEIYPDGQAGALYGQYPPRVNACRAPGEWEYFDIDFTVPAFDKGGQLLAPARISVTHNGHLILDDVPLTGPTTHKNRPFYKPNLIAGPLSLQNHNDTLHYRNVWIVPK
ncbi:MAG: hypothetical protein ACI9OU_001109 [Candidatus Promineifilaceae bacterium]|jgi:hypothetical protein